MIGSNRGDQLERVVCVGEVYKVLRPAARSRPAHKAHWQL